MDYSVYSDKVPVRSEEARRESRQPNRKKQEKQQPEATTEKKTDRKKTIVDLPAAMPNVCSCVGCFSNKVSRVHMRIDAPQIMLWCYIYYIIDSNTRCADCRTHHCVRVFEIYLYIFLIEYCPTKTYHIPTTECSFVRVGQPIMCIISKSFWTPDMASKIDTKHSILSSHY